MIQTLWHLVAQHLSFWNFVLVTRNNSGNKKTRSTRSTFDPQISALHLDVLHSITAIATLETWAKSHEREETKVFNIVCLFSPWTKMIAGANAVKFNHVLATNPLKFGVTSIASVNVETYWWSNARLPAMARFWGPTLVPVYVRRNYVPKGK